MIWRFVSSDEVAELTDSIILAVGADDPSTIAASVTWMEDGDISSDQGPLSVPEALTLAQTKADDLGKEIIYITLQPYTFERLEEWGKLS